MARFDVYTHPDPELRKRTPFLLDVQNSYLIGIDTRVVIPLREPQYLTQPVRDIHLLFEVQSKPVIMDTAAIAAFPAKGLQQPIDHWQRHASEIMLAMDTLFGGY